MLQHGEIPAQLNLDEPNPLIPWQRANVRPVRDAEPLVRCGDEALAAVSSFGFSGTNAHAILAEAPTSEVRQASVARPRHLLHLSAKSDEALGALASSVADALDDARLGDQCFTANAGRAELDRALYVHGDSASEIAEQLRAFEAGAERKREPEKLAFLFTGQRRVYFRDAGAS